MRELVSVNVGRSVRRCVEENGCTRVPAGAFSWNVQKLRHALACASGATPVRAPNSRQSTEMD